MRLSRALQEKVMDLRLRDKLIAEGKVTKAQVEEYLNSLPDDEQSSVYTDEVRKIKSEQE
ncbi:hypothetical protein M899_2303 [Bacteriovorax sp. BSW11_IV]|uniref:hypothetical protein n=1 Tax=Bacteriovorax sp. BSW11_IV TaxID=1353529 RepID=UPI000389E420|nr:hypothetical protein [Bacteriovorax sp. BSW11_IV]EQC44538.1 hypothetical protein M899_2303 [Bacteriovorax sp. BSW11_IV]